MTHLFDDFIREDTSLGTLGVSPSGHSWDLRGPYVDGFPLPAASDGRIVDRHFVVEDTAHTVYATQELAYTPTRVGMRVSWTAGNGGENDGLLVLIVSLNDNFVTDMLHFIISPTYWAFQVRQNEGSFDLVAQQYFATPLAKDGTSYPVEYRISNDTITVDIDGQEWTFSDPRVSELLGRFVVWEIAHNNSSCYSAKARIDAAWTGQNQM